MAENFRLSNNFTLNEFIKSRTARKFKIDNTPSPDVVGNLKVLVVMLLQPLRNGFGAIHITSGYRCKKLNAKVGGSPTSDHVKGMAADFKCEDMASVFHYLVRNCKFTQLIWEFGDDRSPEWLHVSYDKDDLKCQVLRAIEDENGDTDYVTM